MGCQNRQEEFYNCADIEILEESEYLSKKKLNQLKPLESELNKKKDWSAITTDAASTTTAAPCLSEHKETEISNLNKDEKVLKILEKLLEFFG